MGLSAREDSARLWEHLATLRIGQRAEQARVNARILRVSATLHRHQARLLPPGLGMTPEQEHQIRIQVLLTGIYRRLGLVMVLLAFLTGILAAQAWA